VLLAKRLTQRGLFSAGSVAAALSAGAASASPPPPLVASTIKALNPLAAGRAAGIPSATGAPPPEGGGRALLVTRIKGGLAVVLVAAAVVGAAGVYYRTSAAERPTAKAEQLAARKDRTKSDERQVRANPPAQPRQQPPKSDKERMVGNWFITN